VDAGGRLRVGRRLRRPIMIGGVAIRPETIERLIEALPGVREAAVLQIRDGEDRPALKAVVAAPGLEAEAVRAWCRDHLPREQQPAAVEIRENLPRSPAGKVLHKYMAEPVGMAR
jgi:long-chain acyl-CoA synthetase